MQRTLIMLLCAASFLNCSRKTPFQKEMIREARANISQIDSICASVPDTLLGFRFCAPVLLFDATTRHVFANEAGDSLQKVDGVYAGVLPGTLRTGEKVLNWNNKSWLLLELPLPETESERNRLIFQALFDFHESKLGLDQLQTPNCQHLNERENRIWMKIEATALISALNTDDSVKRKEHVRMAIAARKMRKISTGNYFIREQQHDLKKGFPQLIWKLTNMTSHEKIKADLSSSLALLIDGDHIMNAFSEVLFPAYGWLLYLDDVHYLKNVDQKTELIGLVEGHYGFSYPEDFQGILHLLNTRYERNKLEQLENDREIRIKSEAEKYHKQFIGVPFVMIRLNKQTGIAFLSEQMIPFEGIGYIVPELKVNAAWGTLRVSNGALINNENSYLYISAPFNTNGNRVYNHDWQMELQPGYGIHPYQDTDKFIVNRNPS